ncbi:MAG: hypothetical protein KOO62_11005, partial [candidate division Zixibacteria bacterium]|nr:hypothetical protein [candidate division Zixibacteria bacterium]
MNQEILITLRPRPHRTSKASVWLLTVVFTLATLFGLSGSAMAQLDATFELEGNAVFEIFDDWDSLYINGADFNFDLDVYTGVIKDWGPDTTRFGVGTKDIDDIPDWSWQKLAPNDKVDITNGQAALYTPGGNTYLYMATDRFANNGDAAMGLWLLQDSAVNYLPDGSWSGSHVAGTPGPGGEVGDILILSHFTQGGEVDSISVFEWVGSGGDADDILGSEGADQFDIISKTPSTATGYVNESPIFAPWPYESKYGDTDSIPDASFFEGGLDLGVLFSGNVPCFSKFLFTTRTSQSLTASVKDFGLGEFSTIPIVSVDPAIICEGEAAELCATVQLGTGIPPFTYMWELDGVVIPGEITSCISVTTAGYYSVIVTGDNGCASSEVGATVTVIPDPILTCTGGNLTCDVTQITASVTVTNIGELGAVTYLWVPAPEVGAADMATATYTTAGDKWVYVTSTDGCVDSCMVTITEDIDLPELTCTGGNLTCDSTLAWATVVVTNIGDLIMPLTYEWSPEPVSGQGTDSARYDAATAVSITVTEDATGCDATCNTAITE